MSEDANEIPKPDKIISLQLGQKAPWSGILMDQDEFRYLKTVELEKEMIENRIEKPSSGLWWFFGGMALGAVSASLVGK